MVIGVFVSMLSAAAIQAGPTYSVTDIGSGTRGTAINNSGTVVGQMSTTLEPFYFSNGQLTAFTVPGIQGYLGATGINSAGVIVGSGYVNPNTYSQPFVSFIDNNGSFQIVSNVGGTTAASGINNSGVVVGGYALNYGNFYWDPFTYSESNFTSLGAFGPAWVTYANAINDSGTIVGYYSNPNTNQGDNAFSYSNGIYTALGTLPGGSIASASAINNAGVIVGTSTIGNGNDNAFRYSNGSMTDLGTLAGFSNSFANGISNTGAVVGYASNGGSSTNHAFIYTAGAMFDLNAQLSAPIATTLTNAVAINDNGQIVAEGSNGDAYLLSPLTAPEPSTALMVLAGIGLVKLASACARKRSV